MQKRKKTIVDLLKSIRGTWNINPKTRVQDNQKKNKKKIRQESKKQIKNEL